AAASGKYSLHLRAEHEIATDFPERDVIVTPDAPPQFKKVAGKDELKVVLPYDKIPLEFMVGDDVAVAKAEVEYRVNHGDPALVAVHMTGLKTHEAISKDAFDLAGKVHPGAVVEYRIRATDNLPPEFGGPHVIYYPA